MSDSLDKLVAEIDAVKTRVYLESAQASVRVTSQNVGAVNSTRIAQQNGHRIALFISNPNAGVVFIGPGSPVQVNLGIPLAQNATQSFFWSTSSVLCQQEWYAITSGSGPVTVIEVVLQPGG